MRMFYLFIYAFFWFHELQQHSTTTKLNAEFKKGEHK